jgi:1-acyl-sn-glycerol-3-phosphate acyltransferase
MIRDRPEARDDERDLAAKAPAREDIPAPIGTDGAKTRPNPVFARGEKLTPADRIQRARAAWMERRQRGELNMPNWPRWRSVQWIRHFVLTLVVLPALRVPYKLEVRGEENFDLIQEPCVIVSNHNMHLDNGMLFRAMPNGFRRRTAVVAAASDIFGNPIRGFFASLLGNAFPFANEGAGLREGLENIIAMLDQKWNILIFPEGELTVVGPMKRFKAGPARIAMDTGVQVLPIRIDVLRRGFYEGKWFPHPRARVRVNVGRPFHIPPGTRSLDATEMLEAAVLQA